MQPKIDFNHIPFKTAGVYALVCDSTGEKYVGSSGNIRNRLSHHFSNLKYSRHENEFIQKLYDTYGRQSFSFYMLEKVDDRDACYDAEQRWYDTGCFTLNIASSVRPDGPKSAASKEKMALAKKGRYDGTSNPFFGRSHTEETRKRISAHFKGKKLPEETVAKIKLANSGDKNGRFLGFHIVPWGEFPSAQKASDASGVAFSTRAISKACQFPDVVITKHNYHCSPYLKANFDISVVGRTWGSLGFAYRLKGESCVASK